MKKINTIFLFIIFLTNHLNAQTWEKVTPAPLASLLNKVFFVDSQVGWIAGEKGIIYKSIDGGQIWDQQENSCSQTLNSIYFLNQQYGFVGGENRRFLSTSNGGETWKEDSISLVDKKASIRSIFFKDSLNGWVLASISSKGWVLNTTNGGGVWNIVLTVNKELFNLNMLKSGYALVCGKDVETFYYSKDGIIWQNSSKPTLINYNYTRKDIKSVQLVNDSVGYAVGYGSHPFAQPSLILKTTDGGATWTHLQLSSEVEPYELLYDINFSDENNGIVIGGLTKGSVFLKTTNGGINWSALDVPFGSQVKSISRVDNKYWVTGYEGIIATSEDGINWRIISPVLNSRLVAASFPTSNVGYVAGFAGALLKTSNAGKTWTPSYISADHCSFNVNGLSFISENIGFAAHTYGMVSKTTDGGLTWEKIMKDTIQSFINYGISFTSEDFGVVVGRDAINSGVIYKTTNGGLSWSKKSKIVGVDLLDVTFRNSQNGIAAGKDVTLLHTSDGGDSWNFSALPGNLPESKYESDIRCVTFINDNIVIAVGDSLVFKSVDKGVSWDYLTLNTKTILYKVAFEDEFTGYICGRSEPDNINELWKTTNSGETWKNITDSLNITDGFLFSSIAISKPGLAFFAGKNGMIYKYETVINSANPHNNLINKFQLAQNYPNPFNPSTWIEYEIPSSGVVKIIVYDLLGRKVKSLVDGYYQRGTYKINFNASSLASGIYYYTMQFGEHIISRKMQLLK